MVTQHSRSNNMQNYEHDEWENQQFWFWNAFISSFQQPIVHCMKLIEDGTTMFNYTTSEHVFNTV